jgi:hypothetical protein
MPNSKTWLTGHCGLGEVSLFWNYQEAGIRLRLNFVGDHYYKRCHRYMQRLLDIATDFDALLIDDPAQATE